MGYERRKEVLHNAIRGWVNYFKYAYAKTHLQAMDEWLRCRIRMCIWKSWKLPRTRVRNLIKCGIPQWRAYQWGNASKGYWAVAHSGIMQVAASRLSVVVRILQKVSSDVRNRRMRTRMYGGVRGR